MSQIAFHRATSLADACAILAETGARSLAGGTDLIVQMREARREVHTLVEIKQIPELISVIDRDDGGLTVGAAIPAARLARTDSLVQTYPALAAALGMIGSRQIQNRATLGGNVCNASPSADAVPPLIAYDADGLIAGKDGTRRVPLQELFRGPGETCLAPDEILVAIDLPPRPAMSAASYMRFTPRREMDIAVVGVATSVSLDGDGAITAARVALASVAPTPVRSPSAEAALIGQTLNAKTFETAGEQAVGDVSPISDTRASAGYRRDLVRALTKRTLTANAIALGKELKQ